MAQNGSRVVIYYNSNKVPLSNFASMDYTHVILSFTQPASGGVKLVLDGNLTSTVMSQIPTLQAAGKKVMLSLSGGACSSASWQAMSNAVDSVAQQLAAYAQTYGLDGIDIDYEDSQALTSSATYNGTQFLINLTNALSAQLAATRPVGKRLISHAPQPPYFYPGWSNAYKTVLQQVGGQIDFLNVQYYNNPNFQEPAYITGTAAGSVQGIAAGGYPVDRVVVGKPVGPKDAGSGWLSVGDIVSQIIQPLQAKGVAFGGMMGWQAASDPTGSWAQTLADAMMPATV